MKTLILCLTFLVGFQSCSRKNNIEKSYSPISSWLVSKEDSLAEQFKNFISKYHRYEGNGRKLISREWNFDDSSLLGLLTRQINGIDSNISFSYQYRPQSSPPYALHISPDRNKSTIKAIDSLFNEIDSLKYFAIIKYNPPGEMFSKYISEDENGHQTIIDANEIRFSLKRLHYKYVLTCFYVKKIPEEMQQNLVYNILGDEIILKQFDTINYVTISRLDTTLLSMDKLREYFNISP